MKYEKCKKKSSWSNFHRRQHSFFIIWATNTRTYVRITAFREKDIRQGSTRKHNACIYTTTSDFEEGYNPNEARMYAISELQKQPTCFTSIFAAKTTKTRVKILSRGSANTQKKVPKLSTTLLVPTTRPQVHSLKRIPAATKHLQRPVLLNRMSPRRLSVPA